MKQTPPLPRAVRVNRSLILPSPRWQGSANLSSVRHSNLALVAAEIFTAGGGLSRADVATRTGLTKATTSRLVKELLEMGIIREETPTDDGKPGRPGTPLFPGSRSIVGIGLELNVDHVAGYAIDLSGQIVDDFALAVEQVGLPAEEALSMLTIELGAMIDRLTDKGVREICGVGLGIPGIIDAQTHTVIYAPNLDWKQVAPLPGLTAILPEGTPIFVDNDANLQAQAVIPLLQGEDGTPPSFLYFSGDIGIGGAIVRDGNILQGSHGWAGEVGHITIEPDGPECHCGSRGCLERYAGRRSIVMAAGLPLDSSPEAVVAAVDAGHPQAVAATQRAGRALGIAISTAVNLVDIEEVVLGTGLAPLLPLLLPSITAELDRRLLARTSEFVKVVAQAVDPYPASRGGALRCLQALLETPGNPAV